MLYIEQSDESEVVWYVGQPLPAITSRVVKFQADGDELDLIVAALRAGADTPNGEKEFTRIITGQFEGVASDLSKHPEAVEFFKTDIRGNSRKIIATRGGRLLLLVCFLRHALQLGLYEAKMMADGIKANL